MNTSERSVTDARVNLSRLVRQANNAGEITFLTSNGLRVAAIVPVAVADTAVAASTAVEDAA